MKKKTIITGVALGTGVLLLCLGLDARLTVRTYRIESDKVTDPVRLAVLTDLHACKYGSGQRNLLEAVAKQTPDVVLLCGDIVDDDPAMPEERALDTVEALAHRWPTYYVTGNHEIWTGRSDEVKQALRTRGAVVLEGESVNVTAGGQVFTIAGIDDPSIGEAAWQTQLDAVAESTGIGFFSVLLTHRPERVGTYAQTEFDLILAGHAHGGQWRVPGLINGVLAPNQGLFPSYAGGMYTLGNQGPVLIVSRGLARESTRIPRLFNRPEIVIVDVEPAKK